MRALVADDSLAIRRILADLLTKHGFAVDTAEDCRSIIRSLVQHTYDCLILDDDLPDGRGLDILKVLSLPVPHVLLFATATLSSSTRKLATALGVEMIFTKPAQTRELIAHVAGVCGVPQRGGLSPADTAD